MIHSEKEGNLPEWNCGRNGKRENIYDEGGVAAYNQLWTVI